MSEMQMEGFTTAVGTAGRAEPEEDRIIPSEIRALATEIENLARASSTIIDRLAGGGVLHPASPSVVEERDKMLSSGVEVADQLRDLRNQVGWVISALHDARERLGV